MSYEEIARAGGGIASTVAATRAASAEELEASARQRRLDALRAEGVTTVEIKSGYGLDVATPSCGCSRSRGALGRSPGIEVRTSFLGAHALPRRVRRRPGGLSRPGLRAGAAGGRGSAAWPMRSTRSARASPSRPTRSRACSRRRARHGLPVKLHADQLSDLGGAALAARFGALSADHLEYASEAGVAAMAAAGTVAVLLPGAFYILRETPAAAGRRCCAATACRSRSRPTATPAPRR